MGTVYLLDKDTARLCFGCTLYSDIEEFKFYEHTQKYNVFQIIASDQLK